MKNKTIKTLFPDIGGVLLSNRWGHLSRQKAAKMFGIDYTEMDVLHDFIFNVYEMEKLSLDDYLDTVVFNHFRDFTKEDFKTFMFAFQAKRPGLKMFLYPVDMQFNYDESYTSGTPEAYETLLLDIMEGDSTLFMRADQIEAAWKALMPIINSWEANPSVNFPNYKLGMQGPEDAEALIAKNGHSWIEFSSEKN